MPLVQRRHCSKTAAKTVRIILTGTCCLVRGKNYFADLEERATLTSTRKGGWQVFSWPRMKSALRMPWVFFTHRQLNAWLPVPPHACLLNLYYHGFKRTLIVETSFYEGLAICKTNDLRAESCLWGSIRKKHHWWSTLPFRWSQYFPVSGIT